MSEREKRIEYLNNNIKNLMESSDHYHLILDCLKILKNFTNFNLRVSARKKLVKKCCSGYCFDSITQRRFEMSQLIPIHENHSYCVQCLFNWISEKINEDPSLPITCQRCLILNTQVKYSIPDDFVFQLGITTPENLNQLRSKFIHPSLLTDCFFPNCQSGRFFKEGSMNFLCGHYFCQYHKELLLVNAIDNYMQHLETNFQAPIFKISCICENEISKNNPYRVKYLLDEIGKSIYINNKDYYWGLINAYPNFFNGQSGLFRCSCWFIVEIFVEICQSCGRCMYCSDRAHPGLSCQAYKDLDRTYRIDMNEKIEKPLPNGDPTIKGIFSVLNNLIEKTFIPPKIIKHIWFVTNPYMDYWSKYSREKKCIFSNSYNKDVALSILQNGFEVINNFFSFPLKINFKNEAKFVFYLELNYDREIDTDIAIGGIQGGEYVLSTFNQYTVNNAEAIRIRYLIEIE